MTKACAMARLPDAQAGDRRECEPGFIKPVGSYV